MPSRSEITFFNILPTVEVSLIPSPNAIIRVDSYEFLLQWGHNHVAQQCFYLCFSGESKICMRRFRERMTHSEAKSFCRSKGSYLLNHEDDAVMAFIDQQASGYSDILGG